MNECGKRYGASCWSAIINIDGDEALRSTAIFRLATSGVYIHRAILKYVVWCKCENVRMWWATNMNKRTASRMLFHGRRRNIMHTLWLPVINGLAVLIAARVLVVKVATNVARRIAQASPDPGQRHTTTHLYVKYSTDILIVRHEDDNSHKNDRWSAGTTQQSLNEYGDGLLRRTILSAGWPPRLCLSKGKISQRMPAKLIWIEVYEIDGRFRPPPFWYVLVMYIWA